MEQADQRSSARSTSDAAVERRTPGGTMATASASVVGPQGRVLQALQTEIARSAAMTQQRMMTLDVQASPRMAAQRRQLDRLPLQRTVYKIASTGPEHHKSQPEAYAERTGDTLVPTSLHEYKPGEIDLAVATSPITIFIHGTVLARLTARAFYRFLEERGYKPRPDTDIVFITCSGAEQIDEFLVEKGQALADMLGATVHLAKGFVKIDARGVPRVSKPDGTGHFDTISSEEDLRRILPKASEGWKRYVPQGVSFEQVRDEIHVVRRKLERFSAASILPRDAALHEARLASFLKTLKTDRRPLVACLKQVRDIDAALRLEFQPRLDVVEQINATIRGLRQPHTVRHAERVSDLVAEFTAWADSVASGRGDVTGYRMLLDDKQKEWVAPLLKDLQDEEVARGLAQWGLDDDDWLDEEDSDEAVPYRSGDAADLAVPGTTVDAAIQTGSAHGSAVLQRKLSGGEIALHAKTVLEVLRSLSDIDLVLADDGINLCVEMAALDEGTHGLTTVLLDGRQINPHVAIEPETAARSTYTIRIQLSNARQIDPGSLYYTLAHEWELHGRQHARNIARARAGSGEMRRIDHVALFASGGTDMDAAVADQILREEDPAVRQQIFNAYLRDVFAHIIHLQADWLIGRPVPTNVARLMLQLKAAIGTLETGAKFGASDSPWATALKEALAFAQEHRRDLEIPERYVNPSDLPLCPHVAAWIRHLHAFAAAQSPPEGVEEVWFQMFGRPDARRALVCLHELADYLVLPPVTRMDLSAREDDKEAWKQATLLPRLQALAHRGVDVRALNTKLDLREEGARPAAHDGPVRLPEPVSSSSTASASTPSSLVLSMPAASSASRQAGESADLDAVFFERWQNREVEFIPADQLLVQFDEAEAAKFSRDGPGWVTDLSGNRWSVQHLDTRLNRYYLKVGWH